MDGWGIDRIHAETSKKLSGAVVRQKLSHSDESYAHRVQRGERGCANERRWLTAKHAGGRGRVK